MSSQDAVAVKISGVSKDFILNHEKTSSIKSGVVNIFRRNRQDSETQHALKDVSFEIKEGEFFGIVGRNGSGKSTLLKIIAEIYQPSSGSVEVSGKLVPFIELGVGFNPELTGRENVFLNGALLGFSRKEMEERYDEIVEFAELERFMDQKLKNYSSGMQVRLAFAVATHAEADILVVDEVLAVGDADFQRKCYGFFKELKRKKKTVVFVTHDMGAIQQYCDRAMLIEDSKLVEIGEPANISSLYSKMFIRKEKQESSIRKNLNTPSGEERWGDHYAVWQSIDVTPIDKNDIGETIGYEICARGVSNQVVEFPIFGFSIKNEELTQLIGSNTVRRNEKIPALTKNQTFEIKWYIPNVFNSGKYYIDCTIAHDQSTQVSDRWPEAVAFTVERAEDNPYLVYSDKLRFSYKEIKS